METKAHKMKKLKEVLPSKEISEMNKNLEALVNSQKKLSFIVNEVKSCVKKRL